MVKLPWAAVLLLAAIICSDVVGAQTNPDSFPRLAGVNNGAPHSYDQSAYQRDLARLDVVILGYWPGWEAGRKMNMEQVVKSIKTQNSRTRVFLYASHNEVAMDTPMWSDLVTWLNRNNGWLYMSGTSGEPLRSAFVPEKYRAINNSVHGPRDSTGRNFAEWYADWVAENYAKKAPSIDGFFIDNVFTDTRRMTADWNRDGKTDKAGNNTESARWLREGHVAHFRRSERVMPGKFLFGNIADWGAAGSSAPEYNNLLHGGLYECVIGESWSTESWGGFAGTLQWYRKTLAMLKPPKMLVFHHCGDKADYRDFRYGFGISLMDDGYYAFSHLKQGWTGVVWFDEFDVRLGAATSKPPTAAWQKGVWRRDFEGGVVLVNPKGNGAVELDLGNEFRRISGKQSPSVNSGGVAGTVRLADRDAIILIRSVPAPAAKRPRPPANLSVQ